METIFAVSSGRPPAAIAVLRISGAGAIAAALRLCGTLPPQRRAGVRPLKDNAGRLLDRALVLVFPGPASATGEDLVELHCHGGHAVVAAVEEVLETIPGLRAAEAGEFTRRALMNGRIDLAEAEGLADLLEAETEGQRVAALAAAEGRISRQVREWIDQIAVLSARVEAMLDFADEADVGEDATHLPGTVSAMADLARTITAATDAPPVERLRDGLRVVIGGPPNSGKSTLLNLMVERDAAIVSPVSGTTRDRIEAQVMRGGIAYVVTDTAGLTDEPGDPIEAIGVQRAGEAIAAADILIWLAETPPPRVDALWLHGRADLPGRETLPAGRAMAISQRDQRTIDRLWELLDLRAKALLPRPDMLPLRMRQRSLCQAAAQWLSDVPSHDPLLAGEHLRHAHASLAAILGIDATEAMLDALFSRFCIGK